MNFIALLTLIEKDKIGIGVITSKLLNSLLEDEHINSKSVQFLSLYNIVYLNSQLTNRYFIMIRLNCFIQTCAKNRTAVLEAAKELVAASLKDNGNIAYDIFESATHSDVLMICETWKDETSLSAHEKSPHFTTLVPKIQSLAEMKLEKFNF